jgi:cytosine/adenosine deaminase-related metal-dependent hydrolase
LSDLIVRGKRVVRRVEGRNFLDTIEDGAVFQRDGQIVEIGAFANVRARYGECEVIGSPTDVVIPGLVNSHHHIGLTPFQLGAPDLPLELWYGARYGTRAVEPYLDTLYGAIEMIESGVTTVQHLHGRAAMPISSIEAAAQSIFAAYRDIGMRCSYSFYLRDQNRLAYEDDEEFARKLPADIAGDVREVLRGQSVPIEDYFGFFESLYQRIGLAERLRVQLAPGNLHWCSDAALTRVMDSVRRFDVPMHMHLAETQYQKEYARRRTGTTAVKHLHRLGLLGPKMTLGHSTWLTHEDIEIVKDTGTLICHNCSSNFRVRSGVAPLNSFCKHGIPVALGIDEAGLNDDKDMLQEMRLVLRVHRTPGMDDDIPTSADVLKMATENGALTTPFAGEIGVLDVGKAADIVVIDWDDIARPYLDCDVSLVDALIQRVRKQSVRHVIIAGEIVMRDGMLTRIDKQQVMADLARSLNVPFSPGELRRRECARKLVPILKKYYQNYMPEGEKDVFYRVNAVN